MNKRYDYIADKLIKIGIKSGSVLDCGCGEGYGSKILHNRGFIVHGIDLDSRRVKKTKKNRIKAEVGNILELPCSDKSYDIFVCSETLEHLTKEESQHAAGEIDRVCRNCICITVPFDKKICLSRPEHKQYLGCDDIMSLFPGWLVAFRGKFCKRPRRCNRVVVLTKGNDERP